MAAPRLVAVQPSRAGNPTLRGIRWSQAGLGLFLVLVAALAVAKLAQGWSSTTSVLAVARPVQQGHVLEAGDLKVIEVRLDGRAASIVAGDESSVIGQTAIVALFPDDLLTRSHLGRTTRLQPGDVLDPVLLKPGQFPPNLRSGDRVAVIVAPAPGASAAAVSAQAAPPTATVVSVDQSSSNSASPTTTVTLQLPLSAASAIAGAGGVTLAVLPPAG